MNTLTRGTRNAFRNVIRTGSITLQITDDTEVKDNGDDSVIGGAKAGDTVAIIGSTDEDDTAAATITRNPSTSSLGQRM